MALRIAFPSKFKSMTAKKLSRLWLILKYYQISEFLIYHNRSSEAFVDLSFIKVILGFFKFILQIVEILLLLVFFNYFLENQNHWGAKSKQLFAHHQIHAHVINSTVNHPGVHLSVFLFYLLHFCLLLLFNSFWSHSDNTSQRLPSTMLSRVITHRSIIIIDMIL